MNVPARVFLSMMRRFGRTMVLFLIILIIGNLAAGSLLVYQSIQQAGEIAKRSMGAAVSLGIDYEKIEAESQKTGEWPETGNLDAPTIETLGERPEVKYYDYSQDMGLTSKTLQRYEPYEEFGGGGVVYNIDGVEVMENYFNVRGIYYAPILAIEEGKLLLKQGRTFSDDEIKRGADLAVISDKFAETNNLQIGDVLTLSNNIMIWNEATSESEVKETRDVPFEIIGTFSLTSAGASEGSASASKSPNSNDEFMKKQIDSEFFNTIYTPITTVQRELEYSYDAYMKYEEGAEAYDYTYYTPLYVLNSPDELESFTEAAEAQLPAFYAVLSASSQYEQVAAPMLTIQRIMEISLIAVIATGLVIISLVIIIFLRARRQELGIYYALGERKAVIVGQTIAEILLVAVIALIVSVFTGYLLSGVLSDFLLQTQLSTANDPYGQSGMTMTQFWGEQYLFMSSLQLEDVVSQYSVSLSLQYVLLFFGIGISIVLISCIIPTLYMLRLNPKKILV